MSSDWFSDRSRVEKAILGAIKSGYFAHSNKNPLGFQEHVMINSMAKRVYSQLKALRKEWMKEQEIPTPFV